MIKSISGVTVVKDAVGPGTTHTALVIVVSAVHPLAFVSNKVTSTQPMVLKVVENWFEVKEVPFDKVQSTELKAPTLPLVKVTVDGIHTILSLTVNEAINGAGLVNTSFTTAVHPFASVMVTK